MTSPAGSRVEQRLLKIGAGLGALGALATWLLFDPVHGLSFAAGAILAGLNLAWLSRTLRSLLFSDPRGSRRRVLVGYFLRLGLIPLCLYVMIRFTFLGVPALIAGFAVVNLSILIEGILEAFCGSSI